MVFCGFLTLLHFFSIEKKIKEVKAKKIYNSYFCGCYACAPAPARECGDMFSGRYW